MILNDRKKSHFRSLEFLYAVAPLGLWYAVNPQFYTPVALLALSKAGGQCPPYKMVHEFHHDLAIAKGGLRRVAPFVANTSLSWSLKIARCLVGAVMIVRYNHGTAQGSPPTIICDAPVRDISSVDKNLAVV